MYNRVVQKAQLQDRDQDTTEVVPKHYYRVSIIVLLIKNFNLLFYVEVGAR